MSTRVNTMNTRTAGGADNLKLLSFPVNQKCAAIVQRYSYPVTTGSAYSSPTLTILLLVTAAITSLNLRYGPNGNRLVYPTVPGPELRNVSRYVQRQELNNGIASLGVSQTTTVTFDLFLPFSVNALIDGRRRLPGYTQMRTMVFDLVEGPALNAGSSNNTAIRTPGATMSVDVDVVTYVDMVDRWTPVLTYWRSNSATLEAFGPDGTHLVTYDVNGNLGSGGAFAAANLFSLKINDVTVHDNIPFYIADDELLDLYNWNSVAIDDSVAIMYTAHEGQSSNDLPCGRLVIKQATQYVTTMQLRGLYWPVMDPTEASEATIAGANTHAEPVVSSVHPDALDADTAHSRTFPVELRPISDPISLTVPGLHATPGANAASFNLPTHVLTIIEGQVAHAATSGTHTAVAAQTNAMKNLAKIVPGAAQAAVGLNPSAVSAPTASTFHAAFGQFSAANSGAALARLGKLIGKA